MNINWKIIDEMLLGEAETDDITLKCKDEVREFVSTHNFDVFSDESLEELSGIFELSIRPAYESAIGEKIPNIFRVLKIQEVAADGQ